VEVHVKDQPLLQFRWLERGAGTPMVLLHGPMGHMHDRDPVLDVVGEDACAMAPELPICDPALPR
jgi:hypothetical protein